MHRRDLLKYSALSAICPTLLNAKSNEARIKLKKNVVLVELDLGLFEDNYRNGGAKSKYISTIFKGFKDDMTYFEGISEPGMGGGGHEHQAATFTGMKYEDRHIYPGRTMTSLDQHLAEGSIQTTRHKLLYHQVTRGDHMSWNKFSQPMPASLGSNQLYRQLFEKADLQAAKASIKRERDILSSLARNSRRRWKGTPQELDLKASIEYKLDVLTEQEKWLKVKQPYMKKAFNQDNEKAPLKNCATNFRLIYEALEKDQSKVALIQFGGNRITHGLQGVNSGHHSLSHHGYTSERTSELEIIDTTVLRGLKKFMVDLKDGGLFDDTIVLFHCGMADANTHSNKSAPAFLFGGGFKHKTSIQCLDNNKKVIHSTSNLFSSILKQSGFSNVSFNSSKTVIPQLFRA